MQNIVALLRFWWRIGIVPPRKYVNWRLQTAYGNYRPDWKTLLRDLYQYGKFLRRMR